VVVSAVVIRKQFRALNGHVFCVWKFEGKLQMQVVAISFLDVWNLL